MPEETPVEYLMLEQLKLLRTDVQGVKTEVTGVRTEVSGVKAEVVELRAEVHLTNERLERVEGRMALVEESLRDLAAQMLILARFVRNVGDKYDRELEDLKRRLQSIEQKLGA